MRCGMIPRTALVVVAASLAAGNASAAERTVAPPPVSRAVVAQLAHEPGALAQAASQWVSTQQARIGPAQMRRLPSANASWQQLLNRVPLDPGSMLLLRDGTVMVQDMGKAGSGTGRWWRLTPDIEGNYVNGTWSALALMPAGYAPLYFASAVLPDGKVLIEGGEYNKGALGDSTLGALFNPVTNTWIRVTPPKGPQWSGIGDAPSVVLPNGAFMMNAIVSPVPYAGVVFNEATLSWTPTGTAKADSSDEEGMTLLPDDTVMTVDYMTAGPGNNAEIYKPTTGAWSGSGATPMLVFSQAGHEIGPQVLRPDGTVFIAGATGHTSIYNSNLHTWSAGPDFPYIGTVQYDTADAPAAVLPNGKVLIMVSPGTYYPPSHFVVFDGSAINQVSDPAYPQPIPSYQGRMLMLPTGQVLFTDGSGDIEIYTDRGAPSPAWAPVITAVPAQVSRGETYSLTGSQLNGLTLGSVYGDDNQDATNYPIVQLVNIATGDVSFAPTFGSTTQSIAPGTVSSTNFLVPAGTEIGLTNVYVVANGISSMPVTITVNP